MYLFNPVGQFKSVFFPIPGQEYDIAHKPGPTDYGNVPKHLLDKHSEIKVQKVGSF